MNTNALTLSDMHDIVLPEPVSAWPPAPGVWVLLMVLALLAVLFLLRRIKTYRSNAYRREALMELDLAESATDIAEILRRVCMQARGRETVTTLQGETWFQWLEAEGGFQLPETVRLALASVYSNTEADTAALRAFTQKWIQEHSC